MQMRKRRKEPGEATRQEEDYGYRRADGSINLHKFRAEYLETPEECAIVMGEIDKMREEFANSIRFMRAKFGKAAKYEKPEIYRSTMTLWNLAKTARNQAQDRRGILRREKSVTKTQKIEKERERKFIEAAKRVLSREQYLAIWKAVEAGGDNTSRDSDTQPAGGNDD
jgi:hypothetical protein